MTALSPPMQAAFLFASWTVLMIVALGGVRVSLIVAKKRKPGGWQKPPADGREDLPYRLYRAHANCVENLPIVFVLLFAAEHAGADVNTVGNLGLFIVGARVLQSLAHAYSTRARVITVRFSFFALQWCAYAALVGLTVTA